jgi:hypothetical protein
MKNTGHNRNTQLADFPGPAISLKIIFFSRNDCGCEVFE